jgi:hypothetical protein
MSTQSMGANANSPYPCFRRSRFTKTRMRACGRGHPGVASGAVRVRLRDRPDRETHRCRQVASDPPWQLGPYAQSKGRTVTGPRLSPHSQRLKYRIGGICVEPRLELGEQLAWNGRDVLDACHRQQEPFGPGVEGDLQSLCQRTRRTQRRISVSKMLARIRHHIVAVDTQGGNRMRESCMYGSGAARLAAILAGESPANRGVQSLL